jgi:hypothetical protein
MHAPGPTGRRDPKSLLDERSAKQAKELDMARLQSILDADATGNRLYRSLYARVLGHAATQRSLSAAQS